MRVADRTVRIRLEAALGNFRQQMDSAKKATEDLGDAAKRTGDQTTRSHETQRRSLTTFLGENEKALRGMEGIGRGMTATLTAPIAALGGMAAAAGTSYNALEQRSRAALTTLLGDAEAATAQMEALYGFTQQSPFPRQTFIEAQQQLIGFGTAAEDVIPILGAVQDAVAATGGSAQDISEVVDVIARIEGQGRITGVELQRLGIRGIDAANMLAEHFGMSGDELRDAVSAGAIDAEMAIDGLVAGIDAKMGGAAEGVKETWDGATDRVKAAFRDLSSAIVEPFVSVEGGGGAVDTANAMADALRTVESAYRDLPAAGQVAITGTAAVVAGVGPAIWTVGRLGRAVLNTGENLRDMRPAAEATMRFMRGPWGAGIAAATVTTVAAARALGELKREAAGVAEELSESFGQHIDTSSTLGQLERLEAQIAGVRGETSQLDDVSLGLFRGAYELGINSIPGLTSELLEQESAIDANVGELERLQDGLWNAQGLIADVEAELRLTHGVLGVTSEEVGVLADALGIDLTTASDDVVEALVDAYLAGDDFAGGMADVAGEVGNATSLLEEYLDALQRATDPVFRLVSALDDVDAAQEAYNETLAAYEGRLEGVEATQADVEAAAMDLAQAIAGAEAAAIDGDLAYDEFAAKLDAWVDQGVLTAEQAETIKGRVDDAREAAEGYAGGYDAHLAMDVGQAMGALDEFMAKLKEAGFSKGDAAWAARYQAQANATFPNVPDPMGDGPGAPAGGGGPALAKVRHAMSGLPGLRVTSTYRTPSHNARVGGSPTSYHMDRNNPAVDVGGPARSLDLLASRLRRYPHRELLWRTAGHWDHVHFANRGMRIPGRGSSDTVPAMLTPGEYVINADAVDRYGPALFDMLNAQRLNTGGPVGLAGGYYDMRTLFAMTRQASFGDAAGHLRSIEQMRDAYAEMDRLLEAMEQKKRRQALLDRQRAADTAEERRDARQALADFDRDAALAAQRRQIEARIAAAEANQRMKANREDWQFSRMATDQQIADLSRRIGAEQRFTDEWMRLANQRQQLLDSEAQQARRVADDRVADVQRMLDDMEAAHRRHDDARQAAVDRRLADLRGQLSLSQGDDAWNWTAGSIASAALRHVAELETYEQALADARSRGVSDDALEALGINGPDAIGQLKVLLRASDDELAAMSDAIAARNAALAAQVATEMGQAHSDLGRELASIASDLDDELAAIGLDAGRSWADAVAEGLASGIPAIVAAVRSAQEALRDANAAEASAAATPPAQLTRADQIRALFDKHGVKYGRHADGSWENPDARIARLVAGGRSLADLEKSIRNLPKYHSGGITDWPASEERLAWLRGQEQITPLDRNVTAAVPQVIVVERIVERLPEGHVIEVHDSHLGKVVLGTVRAEQSAHDRQLVGAAEQRARQRVGR